MSSDTWISIGVSIPISIACALAVPSIQNWLEDRGKKSHAKQQEKIRDEYNDVLYYATHPDLLTGQMLATALTFLRLIFVYTFLLFIALPLGAVIRVWIPKVSISQPWLTFRITTGLLAICITILSVSIVALIKKSWRYTNLFQNVRFISTYIESIPTNVRDAKREKLILAAIQDKAIPQSSFRRVFADANAETGDISS